MFFRRLLHIKIIQNTFISKVKNIVNYLYDIASIKTGLLVPTEISLACFTALYTAKGSVPSTRTVVMPNAGPRAAIPSPRYCSLVGVDIA